MKVILKRPAFIEGTVYPSHLGPVTIPDALRDKLPKDAKILGAKEVVAPKPVEEPSLRDFDTDRANADAVARRTAKK